MKEYKLDSGNTIIVKQGLVEEESGDMLISWCAPTLRHGQPTFQRLMKKAGHQVAYTMLHYDNKVKEGDTFTTIPGFVDFNIIVHSITPQKAGLFNNSFFNIITTIQAYSVENVCRDAYMDIPTLDYDVVISNLFLYENQLSDFKFVFVLEEQKNVDKLIALLDKKLKKSFFRKFFK